MEIYYVFFIVYFFLKMGSILLSVYHILKNKTPKIELNFTVEKLPKYSLELTSLYVFIQWITGNL